MFSHRQRSQGAQIRRLLAGAFSQKLDPALATPSSTSSVLRQVEDEFGQSVKQGSETYRQRLIPLLDRLLELMALAEADWSETVRESSRTRAILESLRIVCSILVKRFLGVRDGEYLNVEYLVEYEAIFQGPSETERGDSAPEVSSSTWGDFWRLAGSSVWAAVAGCIKRYSCYISSW